MLCYIVLRSKRTIGRKARVKQASQRVHIKIKKQTSNSQTKNRKVKLDHRLTEVRIKVVGIRLQAVRPRL